MKSNKFNYYLRFATIMLVIVFFSSQCSKEKVKNLEASKISKETTDFSNVAYTILNDSFFVTLETAEIFAEHMNPSDTSYHGEEEREIESSYPILDEEEIPCMWVFNYDGGGWIILSADYRSEPIMAYNDEGSFAPDTIPGGLGIWIDASIESINALRSGSYNNYGNGTYAWETEHNNGGGFALLDGYGIARVPNDPIDPPCYNAAGPKKGPLVQTTWGQKCTYNSSTGSCANIYLCNHKYAGCVATAVAQVLHYYGTGGGFNYSTMPLHNGNSNVSLLMKDIGDNVLMNYNCNKSGALWNDYKKVFEDWYQYSNNDYGNYSLSTVISNIINNKPVILKGCAIQNTTKEWWTLWQPVYDYEYCHAWVCDGVTSRYYCGNLQYDLLHMNWGWHEVDATTLIPSENDRNGWYRYNNWTVSGINFQFANDMIYNITP